MLIEEALFSKQWKTMHLICTCEVTPFYSKELGGPRAPSDPKPVAGPGAEPGAERTPGQSLSKILLSCRIFYDLQEYVWKILKEK